MKATHGVATILAGLSVAVNPAWAAWPGGVGTCPIDAVKAGSVCIDKYEASVWQVPATNTAGNSNAKLIAKIKNGTATLANLTFGGATQISPFIDENLSCSGAFPATFPNNGQWTAPLYAVSIPGVLPTVCATWFQAQQACGHSRKRLPSNAEWQLAVAGTQDPGPDNGTTDCNTASHAAVNTGSRSGCVSSWGAFDMVGNLWEWVADWAPLSTAFPSWGGFSNDSQWFAGASTTANHGPGALFRGGPFYGGTAAGPLAVSGSDQPTLSSGAVGFRCAR